MVTKVTIKFRLRDRGNLERGTTRDVAQGHSKCSAASRVPAPADAITESELTDLLVCLLSAYMASDLSSE